jgi:hypothetical protein
MLLREFLNRTGQGKSAVVGWGRGMGHKGHMMLASSVITQAQEHSADPYFVLSRSVGKDDPLYPEEKISIYKKVFPKHGQIFHVATEEMPDLTRVLRKLNEMGYTSCTVVVGADQVKALSYVKQYNGVADKQGNIPFNFDHLEVIARQETNDPSREEEGPRATPMRDILRDPAATDEQKFQAWRDSMSPELSDDEVRDLMHKAGHRMTDPTFGKKPKKDKIAGEGMMDLLSKSKTSVKKKLATAEEMRKYFEKEKAKEPPKHKEPGDDKNVQAVHTHHAYEESVKYTNRIIREMRAREFVSESHPNAGTGHTSELHGDHEAGMKGVSRSRDLGGYDRIYHMNRLMMAMAMHDGKGTHPVDSAKDTWFEKYNTMHPMTQEEDNMIRGAMKTVPTDGRHVSKFSKSKEPDDTHRVSPVPVKKKNRYGV